MIAELQSVPVFLLPETSVGPRASGEVGRQLPLTTAKNETATSCLSQKSPHPLGEFLKIVSDEASGSRVLALP